MFTAECGCIFRTPYSIPPERPCDEATRLLDELAGGMYWDAKRYMSHMNEAWNTLKEVVNGSSNRKNLDRI